MNEQITLFDLEAGLAAKEAGEAAALGNAANAEWKVRAEKVLTAYVQLGVTFTADDLVRSAGLPPSRNGVGALFSAWQKARVIRPVGWSRGRRQERHAGSQRIWRRA